MIEIGKYNKLKVVRKVDHGLYLADEDGLDVLLPNVYVPEGCEIGDELNVFVYRDSEDRIIATTLEPLAKADEFAGLKVIASTGVGAFLDWGLTKDLLVPFSEQTERMVPGRSYVVYVYRDEESDRLIATTKFNKFLSQEKPNLIAGQEVDLLIQRRTPLGFQAIVNNSWKGMLFENEVFQALHSGQKLKGFVKQVRPDGKIDLKLQRAGIKHIDPLSDKILEYLKSEEGTMDITDKSPAEVIYAKFGVSKRAFKQALGKLYKRRLIEIERDKITLSEK